VKHISEEQLALHYYGDSDSAAAVEQHLGECRECRRQFEQLRAVLGAVEMSAPQRDALYENQVWGRLRAHLPERTRRGRFSWLSPSLSMPAKQRWAAVGALAAVITVAFFVGRFSQRATPNTILVTTPGGTGSSNTAERQSARDSILLVAVGDHLERSQMVLIELVNTQPGRSVNIGAQQQAAKALLDDNRLYRQTAMQVRDTAVADVLDELERLLVDLSHRPTTVSEREFDDLRQRIESQGILFKVRIIGSQVRQRERAVESPSATRSQGSRT
jgi:predicted anti-sigma-YlaC factor YlaD